MSSKEWSYEETQKLIDTYPSHTITELKEIFKRSGGAIKTKAFKLGLKKNMETISRTMKTRYDAEIEELNKLGIEDVPIDKAYKHQEWLREKYYVQELSLADIAELTGITRKNVEYWMNKFGLKRRNDETRYTKRYLEKISETGKGRVPFSKGLTKHDHPSIMRISEKLSGENSPKWKGGVCITNSGYRMIREPSHPKADKDGYVLEHRVVMEFVLGRLLTDDDVVHHRDLNRQNNISTNLFVFPNSSAHTSFHNYKRIHDPNITEEKFMEEICVYA